MSRPMRIWLDAHISPAVAMWIEDEHAVECESLIDLAMHTWSDEQVFSAARARDAIIISKDSDFPSLLARLGPPPRIIHLACGKTSNAALVHLLRGTLGRALELIRSGEPLVEIR